MYDIAHICLQEEKRRKMEVDMEFAPEDLALATVPGADFNPKERAFDVEELRPQPIIRWVAAEGMGGGRKKREVDIF